MKILVLARAKVISHKHHLELSLPNKEAVVGSIAAQASCLAMTSELFFAPPVALVDVTPK